MPELLKGLADNQPLFDAVKKAVLAEFSMEPERTDEAVSDVQLGQMFRARLVGIQKIEAAFAKIAKHRTAVQAQPKVNRAR